jgi:hypothetical protein
MTFNMHGNAIQTPVSGAKHPEMTAPKNDALAIGFLLKHIAVVF